MNTLSAIALTTPLMLLGMAAVALPIAAHLLNRRTRARIVFPTIALLKEAAAGQSRLFRLRRLLLLLLRCLAVALIAWAFARPVWLEGSAAGSVTGRASAVVMVLDVSASLGQRADGVSLVTAMRATAGRVLDELEPGVDVANIIFAGARPRPAYPSLVPNIDSLRADVAKLEATQERADLPAALAAAAQMLAERRGRKRIVVVSDLQRTNWEDVQATALPGAQLTVIPLTPGGEVNTALATPRVFPARPIADRPARFGVTLENPTAHQRTVDVSLLIDRRAAGGRRELLGPGERREVSIEATVATSGYHEAIFVTGPDDLEADDRRPLVIDAVRRVPIVLIGPAETPDTFDSTFYLTRALAPAGDKTDDLSVTILAAADVTLDRLRGADAVILGDLPGAGVLPPPALRALRTYVAGGGGLAVFLGEGDMAANLAALDSQPSGGGGGAGPMLPWLPTTRRDLAADNTALHITAGAWSLEPLAGFDEAAKDALAAIPVYQPFNAGDPRKDATTLLKFEDSTPALSASPFGTGHVMLANFSPSARSSDMGKHGVFVALLHAMIDALRRRAFADSDTVVGRPIVRTLDAADLEATALAAAGPDGRPLDIDIARETGRFRVTIPVVSTAGFYTITAAGRPLATISAHIDERESDLRRMDLDEVKRRLAPNDESKVDIRGQSEHETPLQSGATPLWPALVLAAMAAFGLEMLLLSVWKR